MKFIQTPVKGMQDFLPADMVLRQHVLGLIRDTYARFGFDEIETPVMEHIENLIDYIKFNNEFVFYDKSQSSGIALKKAYSDAYRRLSAIYYRRIAENGNVPSMVTLFEMYGYTPEMVSENKIRDIILENWKRSDVTRDLDVPIGKNEHGLVSLNLYEKADGPPGFQGF